MYRICMSGHNSSTGQFLSLAPRLGPEDDTIIRSLRTTHDRNADEEMQAPTSGWSFYRRFGAAPAASRSSIRARSSLLADHGEHRARSAANQPLSSGPEQHCAQDVARRRPDNQQVRAGLFHFLQNLLGGLAMAHDFFD